MTMPHDDCPWTPDRWTELGAIKNKVDATHERVECIFSKLDELKAAVEDRPAKLSKRAAGGFAGLGGGIGAGLAVLAEHLIKVFGSK